MEPNCMTQLETPCRLSRLQNLKNFLRNRYFEIRLECVKLNKVTKIGQLVE